MLHYQNINLGDTMHGGQRDRAGRKQTWGYPSELIATQRIPTPAWNVLKKLKSRYPGDTLVQALGSLLSEEEKHEKPIYKQIPVEIEGSRYILRLHVEKCSEALEKSQPLNDWLK